jgi:magnesium transporter
MIVSNCKNNDGTLLLGKSIEDLNDFDRNNYSFSWIDLEDPTHEEIHAVSRMFDLHDDAVEDCIEGEQRPRIDEYDDHALIVLYGALGPESHMGFSPRKLAVFIGTQYVITVHKEALITIDRLRGRMSKQSIRVETMRTDQLFYAIVDSIVDNYMLLSEQYDKDLDELEESSLSEDPSPELLSNVLQLRRHMLELRRLASSVRELLQPLVTGELNYLSDKIATDFVHVRDHLTLTIETIDNLRELLNGVRDNYHASLALQANRTMQTLTIFASLFLPLSLVAGIYGMNTPLWPSVEAPSTFWLIVGFMGFTMVGMLSLFKYKKWF